MRIKERHHLGRLMRRQVVGDDVNLAIGRLRRHDLLQERDELVAGVACRRLADHGTGLRLQRGVEREGPVAHVLEAVSLGPAGRQRQDGITAVERLNGGLFIDTEDRRMLRRVQVQANNLRGLVLEVGIRRPQIALQAMRLQASPLPRARDNRVGDIKLLAEPTRRPVRRAVGRGLPRPAQNPRLHLWGQHASFRSAMATAQSGDPVGRIARLPGRNRLRRAVNALADGRVRMTIGQQQDDAGAAGFIGATAMRTRQRFERRSCITRQRHLSGSRHAAYYHSRND